MPPRKGKKHATKRGTKKGTVRRKLAAAIVLDQEPPTITVNADGTYDPPDGVSINPGGVVKFKVTYPQGANTCDLTFGPITFGQEVKPAALNYVLAAVGTIKVGSGG